MTPTGLPGSRLALSVRASSTETCYRSLCVGFRFPNVVAACMCSYEAESLQEGAGLLTAHRIPCVRFVWVVRRCAYPSQSRNTRYGWLAGPYPMETFTPKEAPSLLGALGTCFLWGRVCQESDGVSMSMAPQYVDALQD